MSNVDPTVPVQGSPTTQSVRDNFSTIKTELEAFQSTSTTSDGAALLGYKHGGSTGTFSTGATPTTLQAVEDKKPLDLLAFDATIDTTGTNDVSTKVQAAIDTGAKHIRINPNVTLKVNTALTVSGDDVWVEFCGNAALTYDTATNKAVVISGDRCRFSGAKITAPATFDGTNVQPTYSVIEVTGDDCSVHDCRLTNVPKVGIMFADANSGRAYNNTIDGNYPTASYTGTQTGHAGILVNPGSTLSQGDFQIYGNKTKECVQGVLIANYGATSRTQGISVYGNYFNSCWNHGVYAASSANGAAITGNTFVFCQVPIATVGANHAIVGNTIQTGGSSGTITDETGISLRDPIQCTVVGNTITGETGTDQVVINLQEISGLIVRDNVVQGNTVVITGSGSSPLIRVGGGTATTLSGNIVSGNVLKGTGKASTGLILMNAASGAETFGNSIADNTVVIQSASHGIHLIEINNSIVSNNKIKLEHDASGATTLGGVYINNSDGNVITGNLIYCPAAFGTNITFRGLYELGTSSGNRTSNNHINLDPTKLTAAQDFVMLSGSGTIMHESTTGTPASVINAGIGSIIVRDDGGTSTTLYVKESATDSTGWVAK